VVASTPTPDRPVWQGRGITLLGLTESAAIDLPGKVYDVRFVDTELGYALAANCPDDRPYDCALTLAVTEDGGDTWATAPLPTPTASAAAKPTLVPLGRSGLALAGTTKISKDRGRTWGDAPTASSTAAAGEHLTRVGAQVGTWLPDGRRAVLDRQPDLAVRWVVGSPAGDAWWVGGERAGGPAVAVSRDGGATWATRTLPGEWPAGSWAKVAVQGQVVYALVVGGDPAAAVATVRGLTRSVDSGQTFQRYGDTAGLTTIAGDLVPLLDGRLVAAAPGWRVSDPAGTGFVEPPTGLPWVGRAERNGPGWVAYDLFAAGWTAYSHDGETWQKLRLF
jgi:hypothetical protein